MKYLWELEFVIIAYVGLIPLNMSCSLNGCKPFEPAHLLPKFHPVTAGYYTPKLLAATLQEVLKILVHCYPNSVLYQLI